MTRTERSLAVALSLALTLMGAVAQTEALAPEAAASRPKPPPRATKPAPRLLTPAERRDSTATTIDLQTQPQVTRQISIPLGKKPPPPAKSDGDSAAARAAATAPGGIDDAEARCEAEVDQPARIQCRERLKRGMAKP